MWKAVCHISVWNFLGSDMITCKMNIFGVTKLQHRLISCIYSPYSRD